MIYHFDITFEADDELSAIEELKARIEELWTDMTESFDPSSYGTFWHD